VRQTLGQGTTTVRAAQLKHTVDKITGTASSKLQPVRKGAETMQPDKETTRKIYSATPKQPRRAQQGQVRQAQQDDTKKTQPEGCPRAPENAALFCLFCSTYFFFFFIKKPLGNLPHYFRYLPQFPSRFAQANRLRKYACSC
jgi:hypothetical protein